MDDIKVLEEWKDSVVQRRQKVVDMMQLQFAIKKEKEQKFLKSISPIDKKISEYKKKMDFFDSKILEINSIINKTQKNNE